MIQLFINFLDLCAVYMDRLKGNRWLLLIIMSLGFFMILVDITVVNVSIPSIIRDLNANLSDIEWVISAYALSFAALLITFGRLGDLIGKRLVFIIGLAVFTIASFISGEAPTATTLILARILQGIGGAMISPSTLSLISSTFKGRERGIAFGIWGGIAGLGTAVGPILGGFLTTYYGWRWIFRINIPIGIIAIIAALVFVNEVKNTDKARFDIIGMILSSIGFFLLVFALIEGQTYGWIQPTQNFTVGPFTWSNPNISAIVPLFILSILTLVWFIYIQYRETKKNKMPSVNLNFFKFKTYRYGLITVAVISIGQFSSLFTLPLYFQNIKGYDPLQSGMALLPMALTTLITAPIAGRLANKVGAKWIVTVGMFLEFLGILLIAHLTVDLPYQALVLPLMIFGAGIGLAISQNTQLVLFEIPNQESGSASGVLNTVRQVGSALGIAIVGAVLAHQISINIVSQINASNIIPNRVKSSIISTAQSSSSTFSYNPPQASPIPSYIKDNPRLLNEYVEKELEVTQEVKGRINNALVDSINASIIVGSIFVLLGAIASILIPNVKHT